MLLLALLLALPVLTPDAFAAPSRRTYRVQRGDTLFSVSRKSGLPVDELCRLNGLDRSARLQAGTTLKLSSGKAQAARRETAHSSGPEFKWPLRRIAGIRHDPGCGSRLRGIIITGRPGEAVVSSAGGTVGRVGEMRGYGRYVIIRHATGYMTVYANLDRVSVREGEAVSAGSTIGTIDHTDNRLHFQISRSGRPANPLLLLPDRG